MQRILRRLHLLLGCFFAPALLYFAISGTWQLFGYHHILKNGEQQELRETLQQWSNPHTMQAMPGAEPKTGHSQAFVWFAAAMAAGFAITAALGVYFAFRAFRPRWPVALVLIAGLVVPTAMLWQAVQHWNSEFRHSAK